MKTLLRPRPILFSLPDGRRLKVPPITIDQVKRAQALDPKDGDAETPDQLHQRLNEQACILLEFASLNGGDFSASDLVTALAPAELDQLRLAIAIHLHGYDPQSEKEMRHAAAIVLRQSRHRGSPWVIDDMIYSIADHQHCTPDAAQNLSFRDGVALLQRIGAREQRDLKIQAALHGAKLR